jgi:PAS domain S-box-containing protein
MSGFFSEQYLESVLTLTADALLSIGEQGRVLHWSRGAERVFGQPGAAVIGRALDEVVPGLTFSSVAAALVGRQVAELGEIRLPRPDGGWTYLEVRATSAGGEEPTGPMYTLLARDVSGRRADALARQRDEAERQYLLDREQSARAQAEAASVAKDEFLSVLSHELRTPLSTIAGWAELLQSGELEPDEMRAAVETILRNAHLQRRLVEDLLDVSRIVAGRLRLVFERIDLSEPVLAAVSAAAPAARSKGVELIASSRAGAYVQGDPARLTQIVSNLLSNAVKFTSAGGHVEVDLRVDRNDAVLRIADDGKGIESHEMPRLFDRFWMADSSNTRSHGGLGLGLAIVHHLVEGHGGTIRAESEGSGRGSSFIVMLPLTGRAESSLGG